jgi:tetratricopeptide (TPR) repeat protein
LAAAVGLEATEIPAAIHARAVGLANAGEWSAADGPASAAVALDRGWAPYQLTAGLAASRAGDHARAAAAFRLVTDADDLPEAWLNLAAEEAALGDTAAARDAIAQALRLGYQRPSVSLPAGDLALRLGEDALARTAFTSALAAAPSLAGDPWWSADPARAALFPEVRDAAIEGLGPAGGWELAMVSGDAERARSLASRLDVSAATFAEQVIAAWGGDAGATRAVLDECAARPLDVAAVLWCARVAGRTGDLSEANRYRARANTILGGSYTAGAELRVRSGEQVGRSDAGNPAQFYGHYTYRRPTPWDLLVPSLVHLTLE